MREIKLLPPWGKAGLGVFFLKKDLYRHMHIGMSGMMKLLWVR
jgi:hypothetical protein